MRNAQKPGEPAPTRPAQADSGRNAPQADDQRPESGRAAWTAARPGIVAGARRQPVTNAQNPSEQAQAGRPSPGRRPGSDSGRNAAPGDAKRPETGERNAGRPARSD